MTRKKTSKKTTDQVCNKASDNKKTVIKWDDLFSNKTIKNYIRLKNRLIENDKTHKTKSSYQLLGDFDVKVNCLRWPCQTIDDRLHAIYHYHQKSLFKDKKVLDVGCNLGYTCFQISALFEPYSIVGVDICKQFIEQCIKQYRKFVNDGMPIRYLKGDGKHEFFKPFSTLLMNSRKRIYHSNKPLLIPEDIPLPNIEEESDNKPSRRYSIINHPIFFISDNFIDSGHSLLQNSEYDCILLLSIIKYVHCSFGDAGLFLLLRKSVDLLSTNGYLIIDVYSEEDYKRMKNKRSLLFSPNAIPHYIENTLKLHKYHHIKHPRLKRDLIIYTNREDGQIYIPSNTDNKIPFLNYFNKDEKPDLTKESFNEIFDYLVKYTKFNREIEKSKSMINFTRQIFPKRSHRKKNPRKRKHT